MKLERILIGLTCFVLISGVGVASGKPSKRSKASTTAQVKKKSKVKKSNRKRTGRVSWLTHYLPEDRRLITGYWAVVSTDSDTLYHRANCSRMLRQPAGGVLGFPFADDARQAGYMPCAQCKPPSPYVSYAMIPPQDARLYNIGPAPLKDNGGFLGDPYIGADGQPTQKAWELFFAVQGRSGGLSAVEQQFKNSSAYAKCNQLAMQTNQAALADAAEKRENRRKRMEREGTPF